MKIQKVLVMILVGVGAIGLLLDLAGTGNWQNGESAV